MKPVFALLTVVAAACLTAGIPTPADSWKLVWADEFNTPGKPDPANWSFEKGFVRNEEHQWYQPDNAWCENGHLIIEARREQKPNPNYEAGSTNWKTNRQNITYTASSLHTRGLHTWKYGRFEMRGKIDVRSGMWPAFWTLGIKGEWPSNGEIDIMEYYRNMLLANVAWATGTRYKANWNSTKTPLSDFPVNWADKFHVWRMDWDEKEIKLFVDDRLLLTSDSQKTVNPDGTHPFDQPHYILLNLAIGGQNGGDPSGTQFPGRFEVDYVRVYQKQ